MRTYLHLASLVKVAIPCMHVHVIIDAGFWHPIERISHQHWYSKFLVKSRIIWLNYDQDQKSRLHLVACNWNQRFALHVISCCIERHFMLHCTSFHIAFHVISRHFTHFTLFHASFYVISCCISHHFMLHFTHFIVRITCIARISHFTNSTYFMHCTA